MSSILLHLFAALLYSGVAFRAWRMRWQGPALNAPQRGVSTPERMLLLVALAVHALTLHSDIFDDNVLRFGFAIALSVMLWLAILFYWIESFYAAMEGLQVLALPLAAACVMLPVLVPEQHVLVNAGSAAFRIHIVVAMLAYSLFTLAALHALLMTAVAKRLHSGQLSPLLTGLPPLLTMETVLFRLIHVAFVLLTVTLISGILFSEDLFGRALRFDHKTVFAITSWLIFAALLLGRHLRGWRGRLALNWTLTGFTALLLAYVGTRFVLEVLLGRTA
jgi:ABC-type uncharacterized transport system permease subunit